MVEGSGFELYPLSVVLRVVLHDPWQQSVSNLRGEAAKEVGVGVSGFRMRWVACPLAHHYHRHRHGPHAVIEWKHTLSNTSETAWHPFKAFCIRLPSLHDATTSTAICSRSQGEFEGLRERKQKGREALRRTWSLRCWSTKEDSCCATPLSHPSALALTSSAAPPAEGPAAKVHFSQTRSAL